MTMTSMLARLVADIRVRTSSSTHSWPPFGVAGYLVLPTIVLGVRNTYLSGRLRRREFQASGILQPQAPARSKRYEQLMANLSVSHVAAICVAVAASVTDLRTARIPNALTFGAALVALLYAGAEGGWAATGTTAAGWVVGVLLFFFLRWAAWVQAT